MKIHSIVLFAAFAILMSACTATKSSTASSGEKKPTEPPNKLKDSRTFELKKKSTDKTYGYEEGNPILVGGAKNSQGPTNERRFLNALSGPNGEDISYERKGSCCHFSTENGMMGMGLLDVYEIKWKGQDEPVTLYLNMYDGGELLVPVGFTIKGQKI
jgi:hypothetical protein